MKTETALDSIMKPIAGLLLASPFVAVLVVAAANIKAIDAMKIWPTAVCIPVLEGGKTWRPT